MAEERNKYSNGLPAGAAVDLNLGKMLVDVHAGCRSDEPIGTGYNRVAREWCDGLRRDGWLACCKWLRDYPAHPDDTFADVVDAAESQAPGESDS